MFFVFQTFESIKLVQLEKYNRAKTDEARQKVELDPSIIFHKAVENCKPILMTQKVKRGGVIYQVSNLQVSYHLQQFYKENIFEV